MRPYASVLACLAYLQCGPDRGPSADTALVDAEPGDAGQVLDTATVRDTTLRIEIDGGEVATPLVAPPGLWTWFQQPGSACSDGSETGFGVNPGESDEVLVVFMGGGACWDFTSCFALATATAGPFQQAQFDAVQDQLEVGVLDRRDPDNPYRTWSQVLIPYCTGDLHAGERVMSYTSGGLTRTWHHTGALNVRLFVPRIAATFPAPARLVLAGLSAGGYGAAFHYASLRSAFAAGASQLLVDSAPLLIGDAIPATFRAAWFVNWRLDLVVDPICGQGCKTDLSRFYSALAATFQGDRMALVSSLQDQAIAAVFRLSEPQLEVELTRLASDVLGPLSHWRTFLFAGNSHTTLLNPAAYSAHGVDLRTWLARMAQDDPGWESVAP